MCSCHFERPPFLWCSVFLQSFFRPILLIKAKGIEDKKPYNFFVKGYFCWLRLWQSDNGPWESPTCGERLRGPVFPAPIQWRGSRNLAFNYSPGIPPSSSPPTSAETHSPIGTPEGESRSKPTSCTASPPGKNTLPPPPSPIPFPGWGLSCPIPLPIPTHTVRKQWAVCTLISEWAHPHPHLHMGPSPTSPNKWQQQKRLAGQQVRVNIDLKC